MTVERSVGIRQIIDAVALVHPHGFKEILRAFDDMHLAVVGNHVFVQLDAAHRVLSHEEIGLPVVVDKHGRVDKVSVAYHALAVDGYERMT